MRGNSLAATLCFMFLLVVGSRASAPTPVLAAEEDADVPFRGHLTPSGWVCIGPAVPGRLVQVMVEEGQQVKKGDLLGRLDPTPYEADLRIAQAEAKVAQAELASLQTGAPKGELQILQARLEEAEANCRLAEAQVARIKRLVEQKAASDDELNKAEAAYQSARLHVTECRARVDQASVGPGRAQIEVAKARLEVALARLKKAQWQLEECVLRAPVSGTVLYVQALPGEIVDPQSEKGPRAVFEVGDLTRIEVDVVVPQWMLPKLSPKQPCKIQVDAYPEREFNGRLARIEPVIDPEDGVLHVFVAVDLPEEDASLRLLPGLAAKAQFLPSPSEGAKKPLP